MVGHGISFGRALTSALLLGLAPGKSLTAVPAWQSHSWLLCCFGPPSRHTHDAALCPSAGKTCFLCDLLPQKAIMPRQLSLPTSGIQMQACFPAGNHCISDAVSAARMAPAKQSGFPNAACRGLRLPDLLLLLVSHGGYMQPSVCRGP